MSRTSLPSNSPSQRFGYHPNLLPPFNPHPSHPTWTSASLSPGFPAPSYSPSKPPPCQPRSDHDLCPQHKDRTITWPTVRRRLSPAHPSSILPHSSDPAILAPYEFLKHTMLLLPCRCISLFLECSSLPCHHSNSTPHFSSH